MVSQASKLASLPTISVLGCGNMGAAIVGGLVRSNSIKPANVTACDSEQSKISALEEKYSVKATLDPVEAVSRADIVIVAVKPHIVADLLTTVKHALTSSHSDRLLVSVAAGIRTSSILEQIGKPIRVARVMPNLPCIIGRGMTGVFAQRSEDATLVRDIFATLGKAVIVSNEELLDVVTALSASGPAYVFSFIAMLARVGEGLGLSAADAELMATQTVLGAAELVAHRAVSAEELVREVATPGGTTEAGLAQLKAGGLEEVIKKTIHAATQRARELAR